MGWLALIREGTRHPLDTETVVGRGPSADLQLREDFVSSLHAAITWASGGWGVKDLGSHNGTAINGSPVAPGMRRRLEEGDEISFGQASATWTLVDAGAPEPYATAEDSGAVVSGRGGLLALPDADDPEATIFPGSVGAWRVESAEGARDIADRQSLVIGGTTWHVRLPAPLNTTRSSHGSRTQLCLADAQLTIETDADEKGGSIFVKTEREEFSFPLGNTMTVLKRLAQARVSTDGGWLDRERLLDELSMTSNRLNVAVFRLRRQFADAGFVDAAQIVERGHRRLRLGTGRVTVP